MILALLNLSPRTMRGLRAIAAVLPLLLPMAMVRAHGLGLASGQPDLFAWLPLVIYFGVFTVLDYVIGRDTTNDAVDSRFLAAWFRALPVAAVPVFVITLGWAMQVFVSAPFTWVGKLGWILSMGTVSGALAINTAHELIHKTTRLEQALGGFLLSSVCYASFKVEHVHGHHQWVATPRDPSTARLGESVYGYLRRAIAQNVANAWRLQVQRLNRRHAAFWSFQNELLAWSGVTIALGVIAWWVFGTSGLVFFFAQAAGAIVHLEIINYIEHYGLVRPQDENGKFAKVDERHSWNSAYFISNAYLFQLQRHSDHHFHAGRTYNTLQHYDTSPQLPGGYAAMFILALLPPLWRRAIDPRVPHSSVV